jgi:hypothetical protein
MVFKNNQLTSEHRGASYELGKTYTATIKATKYDHWPSSDGRVDYNEGRHYFLTLKHARVRCCYKEYVIVECTIPKGAIYIDEPGVGEGVCNKIIVNKIIQKGPYKPKRTPAEIAADKAAKQKIKTLQAARNRRMKAAAIKRKEREFVARAKQAAINKAEREARAKVIAQFANKTTRARVVAQYRAKAQKKT